MWKKNFKYTLNLLSLVNTKRPRILYGNFGVTALTTGFVTPNNIENLRRKLSKQFKRISNLNKSKIFFRLPIWRGYTKKPMLSRMGKGSGGIVGWKAFLRSGTIFMEILTIQHPLITFKLFKRAINSFPLRLTLLQRRTS